MNITLDADVEQFVRKKVEAGQFLDASALINVLLKQFKEEDEFSPEYAQYLRRELAIGLQQARRGQLSDKDAEQIIAEERAGHARHRDPK
jgi:antitoxin ParD1/3/4